MASHRAALACALVASVAFAPAGCVPAGRVFDARALEARHPELAAHADHRLGDAAPYFAPARDGLALFLCRFGTDAPIPVALPTDASGAERSALVRALDAWEGAGLGVAFEIAPDGSAPDRSASAGGRRIDVELVGGPDGAARSPAADTIADCAVPALAGDGDPIEAELVYASIRLLRVKRDALGRAIPLTSEELVGAAVHELGHALGFPGHAAGEDAVMSGRGQTEAVRRWGRRLEAGRPLESPSLAALYALPSGARVGALPLSDARLELFRALARAARAMGLRGPFARVGDRDARLFWRDADGATAALAIAGFADALRDPARLDARPNARARALVGQD